MGMRVGVGVGQTEPARLRVGDAGAPLDLLGQIGRDRRLSKSTTQPLALKRLCNRASGVGCGACSLQPRRNTTRPQRGHNAQKTRANARGKLPRLITLRYLLRRVALLWIGVDHARQQSGYVRR